MQKDRRVKKKILLFLILLLAFLLLAFLCWKIFIEEPKPDWDDSFSQSGYGDIEYEGHKYRYNTHLKNILFVGIDNYDEIREDSIPGEAGQADCVMLITLDSSTQTASLMQIPRDTMTSIDIYTKNGQPRAKVTEQLATQYSYTVGGADGGRAMKNTVSNLLFELPIDGYLVLDMAAIDDITTELGGVTLTIPEDYTQIDSAFKKGATLTLTGEQAYDYVHYRDTKLAFSNNGRMQRQNDFVPALIDTVHRNMEADSNFYKTLYSIAGKYMVTDLQEEEFNKLATYELDTDEIRILPGEGKQGEKYEEFYLDSKKTEKILIEMFYILKE